MRPVLKSSLQAASRGVVGFLSLPLFRLLWPKNRSSGIWPGQPILPPGPILDPPVIPQRAPLYTQTACNTHWVLYYACTNVEGCLGMFGGVWSPICGLGASECRTESDGVRSQLGPQTLPKHSPTTLKRLCMLHMVHMPVA